MQLKATNAVLQYTIQTTFATQSNSSNTMQLKETRTTCGKSYTTHGEHFDIVHPCNFEILKVVDFCVEMFAKIVFKKVPPCVSIKASGEIPETFIGFMWGEGSRA